MENYILQRDPFVVPTDDGKLIEEHFGKASKGKKDISLARMVAPAGWSEPFQTPQFDEYTLVVKGEKQIEIDDQVIKLQAGQSIFIKAGSRVRYSNPFEVETEYVSLCIPAFTPDRVKRES